MYYLGTVKFTIVTVFAPFGPRVLNRTDVNAVSWLISATFYAVGGPGLETWNPRFF